MVAVFTACAVIYLRRRFVVVRVHGTSMLPALRDGDRVLVRRSRRLRHGRGHGHRLTPGMVALLASPPDGGWVLKRVAAAHGDEVPESVRPAVGGTAQVPPGMLVVLGDNDRSTDSRSWGFLSAEQVLGAVVKRFPDGRR